MIENEERMKAMSEEVELTAVLTLTGSAAPEPVITRHRTPRPACSHGVVFGDPGWGPDGHMCGEMPGDHIRPVS